MAWMDILKGLGKTFGEDLLSDIQDKVDETLLDVKARVALITEMVIKKLIGISFILIGIIFGLVGLGKYLSETVGWMDHGIGYILVGLFLLLLGVFANYMSR